MSELGLIDPELDNSQTSEPEIQPYKLDPLLASDHVEDKLREYSPTPLEQEINVGLYIGLAARHSRFNLERLEAPLTSNILILDECYLRPYLGFIEKFEQTARQDLPDEADSSSLESLYRSFVSARLQFHARREDAQKVIDDTPDFVQRGLLAARSNILNGEAYDSPTLSEFNRTLRFASESIFLSVLHRQVKEERHMSINPELALEFSEPDYWRDGPNLLRTFGETRDFAKLYILVLNEHNYRRNIAATTS